MLPIITLCGRARSGKDTVGGFLVQGQGARAIAFADPLKRFCRDVFLFSPEQLWGESTDLKNAVDGRYDTRPDSTLVAISEDHLADARERLEAGFDRWWGELDSPADPEAAYSKVIDWFGLCEEDAAKTGLSPRRALQTLGTEFGREVDPNVWCRYATQQAIRMLSGGLVYDREQGFTEDPSATPAPFVVITDGRFANEVVYTRSIGGHAWRIDRPIEDGTGNNAAHKSEQELAKIPEHFFSAILKNEGSLPALQTIVGRMVDSVRNDTPRWSTRGF